MSNLDDYDEEGALDYFRNLEKAGRLPRDEGNTLELLNIAIRSIQRLIDGDDLKGYQEDELGFINDILNGIKSRLKTSTK